MDDADGQAIPARHRVPASIGPATHRWPGNAAAGSRAPGNTTGSRHCGMRLAPVRADVLSNAARMHDALRRAGGRCADLVDVAGRGWRIALPLR